MSDMTTIETCDKCGLSYRASLLPHQCATMTTTTNQTGDDRCAYYFDGTQMSCSTPRNRHQCLSHDFVEPPQKAPTTDTTTIHHGTWSHPQSERCLECERLAESTHGTMPCDICQCPMCVTPMCNIHNKHDAYLHVKAQTDARIRQEMAARTAQPAPDAGSVEFAVPSGTQEGDVIVGYAQWFDAPDAGGEWRVVHDGPSRPMIETSDGRLLSLSQFERGRWESYEQEEADCAAIVTDRAAVPKLVAALQAVETAFFVDAQAGGIVEKGKLIPLDDKQHPWIPGARAWPIVEIVRAALAAATTTPRDRGGE